MITYTPKKLLTLKESVYLEGLAAHSGKKSKLMLEPSPGFSLEYKGSRVEISPESTETGGDHVTAIRNGSDRILAVEHLLAVMHYLGLKDVCLKVYGDPGIPTNDACAESYLKLFRKNNLVETRSWALKVKNSLTVSGDYGEWAKIFPPSGKHLRVKLTIDFPNFLGRQTIDVEVTPKIFEEKVAPARSFFRSPYSEEQWQRIRAKIPVLPEDVKDSPVIAFTENHYIAPLKFKNEPAYHKLLDLMGDLYTLGTPLLADIEIYKPGHQFNQKIAKTIWEYIKSKQKING